MLTGFKFLFLHILTYEILINMYFNIFKNFVLILIKPIFNIYTLPVIRLNIRICKNDI